MILRRRRRRTSDILSSRAALIGFPSLETSAHLFQDTQPGSHGIRSSQRSSGDGFLWDRRRSLKQAMDKGALYHLLNPAFCPIATVTTTTTVRSRPARPGMISCITYGVCVQCVYDPGTEYGQYLDYTSVDGPAHGHVVAGRAEKVAGRRGERERHKPTSATSTSNQNTSSAATRQ